MRKPILLLTAFFCITVFLSSQLLAQKDQFEEFIKKQREEFEKQKQETTKKFEELKRQADEEFAQLLSQSWQELEVFHGFEADTTPKPVDPPVARPVKAPEKEPSKAPAKTPVKEPVKEPVREPVKIPEKAPARKPVKAPPQEVKKEEKPPAPLPEGKQKAIQTKEPEGQVVSITFYGTPIQITCDPKLKVDLTGTISEKTISGFWETISTSQYEKCIEQLRQAKERLGLNDWGYCLLLDTVGRSLYGPPTTQRNMFVWFMLMRSGYDARIGFIDNQVYLLLPTLNTLYSVPYYVLNNKTYYITFLGANPESVKSLYTYEGNYKTAEKSIDMNIYKSPVISEKSISKNYTFRYFDKQYTIPVAVNKNIIDYYEFYPQTSLEVYFKAPVDSESGNALLNGLKPVIQNQPEDEAVNMLLRFVQTAFEYKTDDMQFGKEKDLFPEETLYYPFSDCEDRSFLFAFLTRNLLGLDVVGLHYPGHVATAVKFNNTVKGDYLTYNNNTYVICDPTYINANPGECMQKFKNVNPTVILIRTQ